MSGPFALKSSPEKACKLASLASDMASSNFMPFTAFEAATLIQPSAPDVATVRMEKKIWISRASLAFFFSSVSL